MAFPPVSHGPRREPGGVPRGLWLLVLAFFVVRIIYAAATQLAPDEAVYWSWSRHLACGYLDHPPMVAWLIRLSTGMLGQTELGVRFFSVLLGTGCLAMLLLLAGRLLRQRRAVAWVAAIWLTSPLLAGFSTLATPDTSSTFFALAALACAVLVFVQDQDADADANAQNRAPALILATARCDAGEPRAPGQGRPTSRGGAEPQLRAVLSAPEPAPQKPVMPDGRNPRSRQAALWLAFGVLCGLAMVAKYTTVLLPVSVGLALLTSPQGRRQLCRPWPWVAGLVAVAVFSPVIVWNWQHQWASFLFQLRHGLSSGQPADSSGGLLATLLELGRWLLAVLLGLGRYLGGQFLIWTPVLFVIAVGVLLHYWRGYAALPAAERMLLWAGTVPLLFFGYAATRSHGEINWPAFAYFPLSLLAVRWLAETWDRGRIGVVRNGCIVALVGLFIVQVPRSLGAVLPAKYRRKVMAKLDDMTGWPELGRRVAAADTDGRQVVCELHQVAGEVAFYTPGQPDAWPVGDGQRVYAFNYFEPRPDFHTIQRVLFVGANYRWFARRYGLTVTREETVVVQLNTGGTRITPLLEMEREPAALAAGRSSTAR